VRSPDNACHISERSLQALYHVTEPFDFPLYIFVLVAGARSNRE